MIFMAPILEEIEERLTQESTWRGKTLDVECPSFVDDIMASLMDWEGTRDIGWLVEKANKIVTEVAGKWRLPLEESKTESLILRRKRKRGGICYVKWLGIILDDTLQFDVHWQARVKKARSLLGAFNSIGNSQYGISPRSWRQLYTGMIRAVALWGSELGWRGQKQFQKQLQQLQYQALRRATGATIGSSIEKVNRIAAVEDVHITLNASQQRFMARCMQDPARTRDIFGGCDSELGRAWHDNLPSRIQEENQGRDGYTSVASRTLGITAFEEEEISWGEELEPTNVETIQLYRRSQTIEGEEVKVYLGKDDPSSDWLCAIKSIERSGTKIGYSDGSLEEGQVGAGWHALGTGGSIITGYCYVGQRATVWDGEIRGIQRLLQGTRNEKDILLLADSQAAIAAIKTAGRTGKARTKDLAQIIKIINARKGRTRLGWVKSHIGIVGNEQADKLAKKGTKWKMPNQKPSLTEGGVRQWVKQLRQDSRGTDSAGFGKGRVMDWGRKACSTFTQLRTGKGGMASWLFRIGKKESKSCLCGHEEETGDHIMFSCPRWQEFRKGWKTWEDIDLRWKQWLKPHRNERGEVEWVENLVETFCHKVQLQK